MKSQDEIGAYATVNDLLQAVDIDGVRFFELHATLRDTSDETSEDATDGRDTVQSSANDDQNWEFLIQVAPNAINLRSRLQLKGPDADYLVDGAIFYSINEEKEVSKSIASEFLNRVAILALYPFLREALHELARKIGAQQPLLGLYHPGQLAIDLESAEEVAK